MLRTQSGLVTGSLGETLKAARRERGWSLRQAEHETGVSNGYLSLLENGKAKAPSPTVLDALATKYSLPFDDLMEMAGHPSGAVRAAGDASQRQPDDGSGQAARHVSEARRRYLSESMTAADRDRQLVQEIRIGYTEPRATPSALVVDESLPGQNPIVTTERLISEAGYEDDRAEIVQLLLEDVRPLSLDQLGHVRAYIAGLKAPRTAPR